MYQLQDNAIIRLADNTHVPLAPGNRDYEHYCQWLKDGNTPQQPTPPSLDELKAEKINALNTACDEALEAIYGQYPRHESDTWFKQEAEARAYTADNDTKTPFIDTIATCRGIDRYTLAQRIIEKADAFAAFAARVIGSKQAIKDEIQASETVEQLNAVNIDLEVSS